MHVVGLISGGKDSIYTLLETVRLGHTLIALANIYPNDAANDTVSSSSSSSSSATVSSAATLLQSHELDSFMFQTIGHNVIEGIAKCLNLPLYRQPTSGKTTNTKLLYSSFDSSSTSSSSTPSSFMNVANDEIYDLYQLLSRVKEAHPSVQAVACGAILSTYQRTRVEYVCAQLSLVPFAWLWQRNQYTLLQDMIHHNMDARLIKVASFGLNRSMLGRSISSLYPRLYSLSHSAGLQIAGEGGEYETLTLNSPLYRDYAIEIEESDIIDSPRDIAHYYVKQWSLRTKSAEEKMNDDAILYNRILPSNKDTLIVPTIPPSLPTPGKYATVKWKDMPDPLPAYHTTETGTMDDFVHSTNISSSSFYSSWPSIRIHGPLIYVSNLVTDNLTDTTIADDPSSSLEFRAGQEMEQILHRLSSLLCSVGSSLVDVVNVHLYFHDIQHFHTVNKVYGEFFYDHPPSRSAVQAHLHYLRKPSNGIRNGSTFPLVMMDCIVCQGSGKVVRDPDTVYSSLSLTTPHKNTVPSKAYYNTLRNTLYVSSLSYWAPLCIGPYCQSVTLSNSIVFPAGQIGLCPQTMTLVEGGYLEQCTQALRNLARVLQVCDTSFPESVSLTVYVSEKLYENSQNYPENMTVFQEKLHQCLTKITTWFCGKIPSLRKDTVTNDEDHLSSVTSESSYSGVSLDREEDNIENDDGEQGKSTEDNEAFETNFPLGPEAHLRPSYVPPKRKHKTSGYIPTSSISSLSSFPKWSLPVNTIIVPQLPRNASIELECVSFTHRFLGKNSTKEDDITTKNQPNIQCDTDIVDLIIDNGDHSSSSSLSHGIVFYYSNHYLIDQFTSSWFHLGIPSLSSSSSPSSVVLSNSSFYSSLTSLLVNKIMDILIHCKLSIEHLLHLRIYVTGKILSIPFLEENLQNHLHQYRRQRFPSKKENTDNGNAICDSVPSHRTLPALSIIPVEYIAVPSLRTKNHTDNEPALATVTGNSHTVPTESSVYRIINNHVSIYTCGITIHMLAGNASAIGGV